MADGPGIGRTIFSALHCAVALLLLACGHAAAQTLAPHQQSALDRIIETLPPESRPLLRQQWTEMLAEMDEAEVRVILLAMGVQPDSAVTSSSEDPAAQDRAYNRAQYEPAVREAWAAQKGFDDLVRQTLEQHCPSARRYAVFGSGWRAEVYPLQPSWPTAADNVDMAVEILGMSYVPQEGRYRFDFSSVRNDFDRAAVERAITDACAQYHAVGEAFVADAGAAMVDDFLPPELGITEAANQKLEPVRRSLDALLQAQAPSADGALLLALMDAEPVD